jgi:hypothetical protein
MKPVNKFKDEQPTRGTSSYGNSLDALMLSTGVMMLAGLVAIFSYKLAVFSILYFITFVVCLMRFNQQRNK